MLRKLIRQRKLSTRQTLQIFREDQVEKQDDEALRNAPKVDTGVEKAEETEIHLQVAINAQSAAAGGRISQGFIPTPDAKQSSLPYDELYSYKFSQPATYIRFSSTVEDCIGCPFNMTSEDDPFLKSINDKRNASTQCSEDQFEEVMYLFEETANENQPYAAVDGSPILAWEDMEKVMDETFDDETRSFAQIIYEHWKSRRLKLGNQSLIPTLKMETGAETDDGDPYVCFRRREVRQVRKTRGRDAQSTEKLKKLRKELEEARQLVILVRQRELIKKEQLAIDRQLFEQRTNLRKMKCGLPDQFKEDDEDLLINQKPQKKKPLEINTQRSPATQLRPPPRPDGRATEADLISLYDQLADKENDVKREISLKIIQHAKWNEGFVDLTRAPLTPPAEQSIISSFRTAVTEYLPTPPTSASSENSVDAIADIGSLTQGKGDAVSVRYAPSPYNGSYRGQPSFRRRIGRGGRLVIDRRGISVESKEGLNDVVVDRFKYDRDDDDEDEVPIHWIDSYDIHSMKYRASTIASGPSNAMTHGARRMQLEGSQPVQADRSIAQTVSN
ncbi:MAG: Enhancer of polycomb-like protein 1 [Icmadophila ericetorum]|nr:Enhancer of polycomb-like protein 1 [Icmadophila ericetorum]